MEGKLWKDLAKSYERFRQAYDLMMSLLQDLQNHQDPKKEEKEKNK
jgi:hypothetical protein